MISTCHLSTPVLVTNVFFSWGQDSLGVTIQSRYGTPREASLSPTVWIYTYTQVVGLGDNWFRVQNKKRICKSREALQNNEGTFLEPRSSWHLTQIAHWRGGEFHEWLNYRNHSSCQSWGGPDFLPANSPQLESRLFWKGGSLQWLVKGQSRYSQHLFLQL